MFSPRASSCGDVPPAAVGEVLNGPAPVFLAKELVEGDEAFVELLEHAV